MRADVRTCGLRIVYPRLQLASASRKYDTQDAGKQRPRVTGTRNRKRSGSPGGPRARIFADQLERTRRNLVVAHKVYGKRQFILEPHIVADLRDGREPTREIGHQSGRFSYPATFKAVDVQAHRNAAKQAGTDRSESAFDDAGLYARSP